MQRFFDTVENRWLTVFALAFGISSFFFVARETDKLSFLAPTQDTAVFYALYIILGILTVSTLLFFGKRFDWKDFAGKLLITFFPAEVLLIFGLTQSRHYHYLVFIGVGLYLIAVGILLIGLRHAALRTPKQDAPSEHVSWFKLQGSWRLAIVALVTLTYLGVGLWKVGNFAAVDEALWTFDRIPNFWKDISYRVWEKATVSDKPGVTVAYVSGTGLLSVNPKQYSSKHWNDEYWRQTHDIRDMNFPMRAPIVIFTALLLPLFYFLLERTLGRTTALIATVLIGTSPFLIGMARIINPDSLLWTFAPLSLFAYFAYRKRGNLWYLYGAGILLGLALLTKYVANIILVFLLGHIFLEYIFLKKSVRASSDPRDFFRERALDYLTVTFTAIAVFYLLYPVTWVKPYKILDATLLSEAFASTWPLFAGLILFLVVDYFLFRSRIVAGVLDIFADHRRWLSVAFGTIFLTSIAIVLWNAYSETSPYDFHDIIASPKSAYAQVGIDGIYFGNFYPMLFGITPLAFIGLVLASSRLFFRSMSRTSVQTTLAGIIFILLYYVGASVNHVAMMNRYQVMLYPIALILAAIGLREAFSAGRRSVDVSKGAPWRVAVILGIFALSFWSLWTVRPHYLAYASGLLPDKYYVDIKDMGTGSYEAAMYLNSLPDAATTTVWTDKNGVCMFFVGKCYSTFNFEKLRERSLDYVVVSAGRESRTTKMMQSYIANQKPGLIHFETYYAMPDEQADFVLHPDNRSANYVKVFRFSPEPTLP